MGHHQDSVHIPQHVVVTQRLVIECIQVGAGDATFLECPN